MVQKVVEVLIHLVVLSRSYRNVSRIAAPLVPTAMPRVIPPLRRDGRYQPFQALDLFWVPPKSGVCVNAPNKRKPIRPCRT